MIDEDDYCEGCRGPCELLATAWHFLHDGDCDEEDEGL